MQSSWPNVVLAIAAIFFSATFTGDKVELKVRRESSRDLELSGNLPGLPADSVRFLSYSDLSHLPQITVQVSDDPNFHGVTEVSGVDLNGLLRTLGIADKDTLVAAVCDDDYEAHYTEEYRRIHRPVLVLKLNGKPLEQYTRTADGGAYGPYLISHASFKPRYHILAHAEEAQIPNGVIELRFLKQDLVLDSIRPPGKFGDNSAEMQGYRIAEQNCFRCHNAGEYGGHKSGRSWRSLAHIATTNPAGFAAYIKNPQSQDPTAAMPGNPEYDDSTLHALTAYFQTFAPAAERSQATR